MNQTKIILDLCGGTGAWSKPYKEAGYNVLIVTMPELDVRTFIPPENIYGILAAPPCTMFSLARTTAKTPRDLKQGMEIVIACLNIIWGCRYKSESRFWALENPMGYLRQFLGKPSLTFDPFEYGDPYSKKTDIWGYFNMPNFKAVELTEQQKARCKINNRELPKLPLDLNGNQASRRAITPPAFAQAFFEANQ